MLFRAGLRAAEAGAVFTLELDGEGVEVADEEEAVVMFGGAEATEMSGESVEFMVG